MAFIKHYWKSILWVTGILYASFTPSSSIDERLYFFKHQDKIIHIGMYFVLSFLVASDIFTSAQLQTRTYIILFALIVIFSGCIEILQPIIANRSNEIADVVANGIGTFLGLLIFYIKKGRI